MTTVQINLPDELARDAQAAVLTAAQIRGNLAASSAIGLYGRKRQTAALTAMHERMAPALRQGFASPGCKKTQPALDPAPGQSIVAAKQFLCRHKISPPDFRGFRPPFTNPRDKSKNCRQSKLNCGK